MFFILDPVAHGACCWSTAHSTNFSAERKRNCPSPGAALAPESQTSLNHGTIANIHANTSKWYCSILFYDIGSWILMNAYDIVWYWLVYVDSLKCPRKLCNVQLWTQMPAWCKKENREKTCFLLSPLHHHPCSLPCASSVQPLKIRLAKRHVASAS